MGTTPKGFSVTLYPAVKTICPTLISDEGAGKGTLNKLIQKMLGSKKCMESTNPSRDVWGQYNHCMTSSFFVTLNELSKKDTQDAEGKIKALITDGNLWVNPKGVNQFEFDSNIRSLINNKLSIDKYEKIKDIEYIIDMDNKTQKFDNIEVTFCLSKVPNKFGNKIYVDCPIIYIHN